MFHLKNLLSEYTMHWQKIKSWTFENGVYFFATITTYYRLYIDFHPKILIANLSLGEI